MPDDREPTRSDRVTPWLPGRRRELASTRILKVYEQDFDCPDHPERSGAFTVIETNDWVNVIAITRPDAEGKRSIVLVEQFRFGTAENTLEIPGGVVDLNEDPLVAGPRELLEETGYTGDPPRVIGAVDANPAIMTNRATTLLIENCEQTGEVAFDEHEQIAVRLAPVQDLRAMVADGRISNAVVVAALFHFLDGLANDA